jgi:hypothetical protein
MMVPVSNITKKPDLSGGSGMSMSPPVAPIAQRNPKGIVVKQLSKPTSAVMHANIGHSAIPADFPFYPPQHLDLVTHCVFLLNGFSSEIGKQ